MSCVNLNISWDSKRDMCSWPVCERVLLTLGLMLCVLKLPGSGPPSIQNVVINLEKESEIQCQNKPDFYDRVQ